MGIQVPPERDQPYEVPFREVEHQEEDDVNDDWAFRSYPVGSIREQHWWGDQKQADEDFEEIERCEAARKKLGGFGFQAKAQ